MEPVKVGFDEKLIEKLGPVTEKYPLHLSYKESEAIDEEVKRMCKAGVITEVKEEEQGWCSQIRPVTKPNGSIRLCINYRKVNERAMKNNYPAKDSRSFGLL